MSRIKYLVMDVDGTLTDGKIYMGNDGEFCKAFSIKDGCGIHDIAIPGGIIPVIITGEKYPMTILVPISILHKVKRLPLTVLPDLT